MREVCFTLIYKHILYLIDFQNGRRLATNIIPSRYEINFQNPFVIQ